MSFKKIAASILAGAMLIGSAVPVLAAGNKVTTSGSTALLPLTKTASELFMTNNPGVSVNVSGGGSFTGLKQVNDTAVDIGCSDVPAEGPEYKDLVATKVAVAPFVMITHPSNSINNLSQDQLIGIYTGKITNWKEVGGADQAITIIGRSKTSGSRATIKTIVLKGQEFTDNQVTQDSNGAVRTAVASTPGAIGYVDAPYLNEKVKLLKYNTVEYSDDNVVNGKYPIWTYGYMYTKGNPEGNVKKFIDMIISDSFQQTFVDQMGFISMSRMQGKKAQTETVVNKPVVKKPTTPAPIVKKPTLKYPAKPGATFIANGKVWKVGKDGKHYFVKVLKKPVGSTFVANGKVWKVGADGKDYYVKQAR